MCIWTALFHASLYFQLAGGWQFLTLSMAFARYLYISAHVASSPAESVWAVSMLKAFAGSNPDKPSDGNQRETSNSPVPTGGLTPPARQEKPKRPSPVEVRNASDFSERFKEMGEDLTLVLTVLTGIGMTIAVLSIVNTMLMSVSERVIEFGVLKANGWTPWDVLQLITAESATLGLGGGILGALIGWVATRVINAQWPDRVNLFASPGLLVFSVAFSTVVGLLGGLYPAIWAMRLSPMEAIRRG